MMTLSAVATSMSIFLLSYLPWSKCQYWSPGCKSWPQGVPAEHKDEACDRNHQFYDSYWKADLDNPEVVLELPEDKTSLCPAEDILTANDLPSPGGHQTRWVIHNAASTPVILSMVNHQGIEVSVTDAKTHPPEVDNKDWPDGAMLPPGFVAIINNGFQGQTFLAREVLENPTGGRQTIKTGRILLKRRRGLVYVRNDKGAKCPKARNLEESIKNDPMDTGKEAEKKINSPINDNPDCNFVEDGFINKVGCGIDLYFATGGNSDLTAPFFQKGQDPPACERFTTHLGVNPRPTNYITDHSSPVAFMVTYNTHRFIARMSHDNSLVGEIIIDHDVVHDCPVSGTGDESNVFGKAIPSWDAQANADAINSVGVVPHDADGALPFVNITEVSVLSRQSVKNLSKMDTTMKTSSDTAKQ